MLCRIAAVTYDQLAAFLAVAAEGAFTAASAALHKSQPAVSKLVRNLEQELGPEPAFSIGRAEKATAAQVEFLSFSGTARWHAKVQRLKYSHLTSLQVNTRYANFYQRHFDRNAG